MNWPGISCFGTLHVNFEDASGAPTRGRVLIFVIVYSMKIDQLKAIYIYGRNYKYLKNPHPFSFRTQFFL